MKTIGLIGGMSWESSAMYYQLLNQGIKKALGGHHSAKCVIVSVDFAEIEQLQRANDWDALDKKMVTAAKQLESAGAEMVILGANTMHLCSPEIIENTSIPFLHIAKATAENIVQKGLKKVGLLGTKFTMEKDFYKTVLTQFNIEVVLPNSEDRALVHNIIYEELVHGQIKDSSKEIYKRIMGELAIQGAEGIILGCTEIPLLIQQEDVQTPIFDTTKIHAAAAVSFALETT